MMTIQPQRNAVSSSVSGKPSPPAPSYTRIPPQRSLAHEIVERIRSDIAGGALAPGARLPTEQEMIAAFGVSRTVVREAVAALRAEGLVATRQGVGAFVAESADPRPFRIEPGGLASIEEVLALMELRTGVETEAAGLAAERAGRTDIRALEAALKKIDTALKREEMAIGEDFAFHQAIAAATRNPHFMRFLEFLGRYIIPRQSVRVLIPRPLAYLRTIQAEHRVILAAIRGGSPREAQAAMRRHLTNGRERYASLAARAQKR
jgi:GntR family transcriptional repressor for pyruvate dehydrogenase complex